MKKRFFLVFSIISFNVSAKSNVMAENSILLAQKKLVQKLESLQNENNVSIVEMKKDYATDNRICLTSQTFIPYQIAEQITHDLIIPLKKIDPHHYYFTPENMHITMKNIRCINNPPTFDERDLIKVDRLFSQVVPQFPSFNFILEDLILLPTSLCIAAYADESFQRFVTTLDKELNKINIPDDKKYLSKKVFWGNLTICRFTEKPSVNFKNFVQKFKNYKMGKLQINTIHLVSCNAICHPSSLKIIGHYNLKKSL